MHRHDGRADLALLEHPASAARETNARSASTGVVPVRCASSRKLRAIRGPRTGPGGSAFTVTPSGPTSAASVVVSPRTAVFEAQAYQRSAPDTAARTRPFPDAVIEVRDIAVNTAVEQGTRVGVLWRLAGTYDGAPA